MNWVRKIGYFSAFIIPGLTIVSTYYGGIFFLFPLLFVFLFIPLTDILVGRDTFNVSKATISQVANDFYYRFITYCWTYFQIAFIIWGAWIVATKPLTIAEWILFLLAVALSTGGIGITVAHELGHKKSALERFYSKALLMSVCYMHFYIEHNKGHHVHVATPEDPATARYKESFYQFWWRSVTKGYLSAWRIENKRLERKSYRKISIYNQMIWFTITPLLFCLILTTIISTLTGNFTWQVPLFFFAQSFLAFSLLEAVNYIEHYGLQRNKIDEKRYERVAPHHSWNASEMISNFFLFQLQRHSDHHFNAIKRYQVLNHYEQAPQLPAGYSTMVMISLIPPLWFKLMNPRLERFKHIQTQTSI